MYKSAPCVLWFVPGASFVQCFYTKFALASIPNIPARGSFPLAALAVRAHRSSRALGAAPPCGRPTASPPRSVVRIGAAAGIAPSTLLAKNKGPPACGATFLSPQNSLSTDHQTRLSPFSRPHPPTPTYTRADFTTPAYTHPPTALSYHRDTQFIDAQARICWPSHDRFR